MDKTRNRDTCAINLYLLYWFGWGIEITFMFDVVPGFYLDRATRHWPSR